MIKYNILHRLEDPLTGGFGVPGSIFGGRHYTRRSLVKFLEAQRLCLHELLMKYSIHISDNMLARVARLMPHDTPTLH